MGKVPPLLFQAFLLSGPAIGAKSRRFLVVGGLLPALAFQALAEDCWLELQTGDFGAGFSQVPLAWEPMSSRGGGGAVAFVVLTIFSLALLSVKVAVPPTAAHWRNSFAKPWQLPKPI